LLSFIKVSGFSKNLSPQFVSLGQILTIVSLVNNQIFLLRMCYYKANEKYLGKLSDWLALYISANTKGPHFVTKWMCSLCHRFPGKCTLYCSFQSISFLHLGINMRLN
jgi:hypothetical protein